MALFRTFPALGLPSQGRTLHIVAQNLFEGNDRHDRLSSLMDGINRRFGRKKIGFEKVPDHISKCTGHAAFQRVPEDRGF